MNLMETHEAIHMRFNGIIKVLSKLIRKKKIIDSNNLVKINNILDTIENMQSDYIIQTSIMLNKYLTSNKTEKNDLVEKYDNYMCRTNVDGLMTSEMAKIKQLVIKSNVKIGHKLNQLFNRIENNVCQLKSRKVDFNICTVCENVKEMCPSVSELHCLECADIEVIEGTAFEDHAVQDPNKQTNGDYDPTRFVEVWIDRILADRDVNFKDKITGKESALLVITKQKNLDGIKNPHQISCEYIRKIWKATGYTKFNDEAPYARYRITKIKPPSLTYKERKFVKNMTIRIMRLFNIIKDPERSNSLYYAYVIYKIIKQFYAGRPEIRLLESIHIQKDDTLVYNDTQYEKICEIHNKSYRPHLKYEPTVPDSVLY